MQPLIKEDGVQLFEDVVAVTLGVIDSGKTIDWWSLQGVELYATVSTAHEQPGGRAIIQAACPTWLIVKVAEAFVASRGGVWTTPTHVMKWGYGGVRELVPVEGKEEDDEDQEHET